VPITGLEVRPNPSNLAVMQAWNDATSAWQDLASGSGVVFGTGPGQATEGNDARVVSAVQRTLIDAKGDLLVGTANDTVARLPVSGVAGRVLTEDPAEAAGVKWAAAPRTRYALRTPSSGNTVSTPASFSYTSVTELEATWLGVFDALPGAAPGHPISQFNGTQDAWGITVTSANILYFTVASGAVASFATWTNGTTTAITPGDLFGIRLSWRANNGSGVPDMRLFTSHDEGATWTLRDTNTAVAAASINAGATAPIVLNGNAGANHVNGRVHYAQIRTDTGSGLVERASWNADTARGPRDSDPQGNVWTINGSAWSWRTR
jgi:hypothetical protein